MKLNNILSRLSVATVIFNSWLLLVTPDIRASDLAREQRLADQIVDAIFDGEPVYLEAGGHRFLTIYTRSESHPARGAAMILHGRGTHPDWEQVANPLRTGLPSDGWDTLALQMPVLEKDATFYDYLPLMPEAIPRIDAGIEYLREQGYQQVVLIAHSCGVHMSMAWIDQRGDSAIDAYVGIGMGATDYRQPMKQPFPLHRIRVPMLNIYGSADYPAVHRQAAELGARMGAMNPRSRQIQVQDANHYFDEHETELTRNISNWLNNIALIATEAGAP